MSNEEMVIRIQQGEREQFRALWAQVERYVYMRARWRALVEPENGGFEELPERTCRHPLTILSRQTFPKWSSTDFF